MTSEGTDQMAPTVSPPFVGWYGDDFTGATDTLATLAQAGHRAMLFLDVPTPAQLAAAGPLEAVGIAGAARAMSPDQMREALAPVGDFFEKLAPRVLHYKVCSTFDSSRSTGNIVAAIQSLLPHVESGLVPIVGGQPNLGRYCVFGNLFARAGAQGDIYRIDRHPTMSCHPVTPMAEADLRVHLAQQGGIQVSGVPYPVYEASAAAQDDVIKTLIAAAPSTSAIVQAMLLDVARAADLPAVGRIIWTRAQSQRLLAVGPSSVVQALLAHFEAVSARETPAVRPEALLAPTSGPVFVFAGSLSPVTLRQIEAATRYRRIALNAQRMMTDPSYLAQALTDIVATLADGTHTLVYTNTSGEGAIDTREAAQVARVSAHFVVEVVERMRHIAPLRRIGIAGGDTSSQVTRSLGLWALSYMCTAAAGVTICRTHSEDPTRDGVTLMLKGGQVGDDALFDRFAA